MTAFHRITGRCSESGNSPRSDPRSGCVGRVAGFCNTRRMTTARPGPRRPLRRWTLLVAWVLCVGQTVADTHVHLDEHEEEACTFCAVAEPGHVPESGRVEAQPSEWNPSNGSPVYLAIRSPRPYAIGRPRAPPVSAS